MLMDYKKRQLQNAEYLSMGRLPSGEEWKNLETLRASPGFTGYQQLSEGGIPRKL